MIEPRVMRVLVALADGRGKVITREDLIDRCWDGVVVGDDAVNRAISELRRISREVDGQYTIQTIPRVGYRILDSPAFDGHAPGNSTDERGLREPTRRLAIGATLAALSLGGIALLRPRSSTKSRSDALVLRGAQAIRDGLPDGSQQGIGFLREAVSLDPGNATGWGLLALGLRNVVEFAPPGATASALRSSEIAITRALAIDTDEPNALAARATLQPAYGDWLGAENRLKDVLRVAPDHAWSLSALGYLMESVGRSSESTRLTMRAVAVEPLSPVFQYRLAYKYWITGQPVAADQVIDRAVALWPRHPAVVFARFLLFVWTGRYAPATAMLDDSGMQQAMMDPQEVGQWQATINALQGREQRRVEAARKIQLKSVTASPTNAVMAIQILSLLGQIDEAFQVADGFLLRQGALIGRLSEAEGHVAINDQRMRKTVMLFSPNTAPMRADRRFMSLVEAIGMVDYWNRRGIRPDFLRG